MATNKIFSKTDRVCILKPRCLLYLGAQSQNQGSKYKLLHCNFIFIMTSWELSSKDKTGRRSNLNPFVFNKMSSFLQMHFPQPVLPIV